MQNNVIEDTQMKIHRIMQNLRLFLIHINQEQTSTNFSQMSALLQNKMIQPPSNLCSKGGKCLLCQNKITSRAKLSTAT